MGRKRTQHNVQEVINEEKILPRRSEVGGWSVPFLQSLALVAPVREREWSLAGLLLVL